MFLHRVKCRLVRDEDLKVFPDEISNIVTRACIESSSGSLQGETGHYSGTAQPIADSLHPHTYYKALPTGCHEGNDLSGQDKHHTFSCIQVRKIIQIFLYSTLE